MSFLFGTSLFRVATDMTAPRVDIEKLVNYAQLADLSGLPVRTLRTLVQRRVIPAIRLGHRTTVFRPSHVMTALERFEARAVSDHE